MIKAVLIFILVASFFLVIYGSNQNISEDEKELEDQEQMEYLRKFEEQKVLKEAERIKNRYCKKNGEIKK